MVLLSAILFCLPAVQSEFYQIVTEEVNVPQNRRSQVDAKMPRVMETLLDKRFGFDVYQPGDDLPCPFARNLLRGSEIGDEHDRDLQAGSQCPAKCYSGSPSIFCRGCCGRCGNRRELSKLNENDIAALESKMNKILTPVCANVDGCKVTASLVLLQ